MAGVGFILRKLFRRDDLSGVAEAYLHAIVATSGPWVFTVIALGSLYLFTKDIPSYGDIDEFRAINLYNFCFSLVFTAPFTVIATRYIADCIFVEDLKPATGMFIGVLICIFAVNTPIVIPFYLFLTNLTLPLKILSCIQFYLISVMWVCTVFISTLKHYKGITISFLLGMALAVLAAMELGQIYGTFGLLLGFTLGILFVVTCLTAFLLTEYPRQCTDIFAFISYFKKYPELAWGGLFYSLAIWVDKWVMWLAPEAVTLPCGLVLYPYYDSAMFIAYLTVIPAMGMYMLTQETSFFELYVKYYQDIQKHASFKKIQTNLSLLENCIGLNGRNVLFLQIGVCGMTILMTPFIFNLIGLNYIQISMFRYGVLGAAFHVITLFLMITMSYFEYRKGVLFLQFYFFLTNTIFSFISMLMGFTFYGYGYFLSALTTFVLSAIFLKRYLTKLSYHTFITTNASV